MQQLLVIILLLLTVVAIRKIHQQSKRKQRQVVFNQPFPPSWQQILQQQMPLYNKLPPDLQKQLQGHINVFLAEKKFYGCDDLNITDEIRIIIAAQACLLLLNKATDYYPNFQTILVYPARFTSQRAEHDGEVVIEHKPVRSGESWHRGPVIISWQDAKYGSQIETDGENVVLHEFAHKLDEENPDGEGLPLLASSAYYVSWARVLSREFTRLNELHHLQHKQLINDYAKTSPAEFFAVLTELYFEKPGQLHNQHPELYKELYNFYRVDPVSWHIAQPKS